MQQLLTAHLIQTYQTLLQYAPLANITCQSGTDVLPVAIRWHNSFPYPCHMAFATTQAVLTNGVIEIEYQKVGDTVWQKYSVAGSEVQAFFSPVDDGAFYIVRARAVNPYVNVKVIGCTQHIK